MRVVFFGLNTIRHPAWVVVRILPPLLKRMMFDALLLVVVGVNYFLVAARQSGSMAILLGAAPILLGTVFISLSIAVHEMSHAFAGARLVDVDYPLALAVPTFGSPFVRFDPHHMNVPPAYLVVILLMGSVAGLFVSALIFVAVLAMPDPWNTRWVWEAYCLTITFPQVVTLLPIGQTDGAKVMKLMREKSISWLEVGRAARRLFRP